MPSTPNEFAAVLQKKLRIEQIYCKRLRSLIGSIQSGDRHWTTSSARGKLPKQDHSMLKSLSLPYAYIDSKCARIIAIHFADQNAD